MAKEAIPTPINTVWAEQTPNTVTQTDDMRRVGIEFQSLIVSNQLNSAFKTISEAVRWIQASGGMWQPNFNYSVGNLVSVIVTLPNGNGLYECQWFRCVADNTNTHPYNVATPITQNGVTIYSVSGAVNPAWVLCNGFEKRMEQKIDEAISDQWLDLGTAAGSFNLNFGGANNNYNNFFLRLAGNTSLGTATFAGAKERSGLFCILSGGKYLQGMFSNSYCGVKFPVKNNAALSGDSNKLVFPYKLVPSGAMAGIYFTMV